MLGVVESLVAARMIVVEDEEPAVVGEVDRWEKRQEHAELKHASGDKASNTATGRNQVAGMVQKGSRGAFQEENHPCGEAAGALAVHAAKLGDSQVVHPSQDTGRAFQEDEDTKIGVEILLVVLGAPSTSLAAAESFPD